MDGDADNYRHCVFKLLIFSPLSLSVNTTPTFNIANTKADIVRNSKLSLIPVKNTTGQFKVKLYFFLVRGYRLHPPWGGTGTVLRGPIDTIKNAGNKNIRQEAFEKCCSHSLLRAAARHLFYIAIHQVSLLLHAATVARRLRIDVHNNINNNDNA